MLALRILFVFLLFAGTAREVKSHSIVHENVGSSWLQALMQLSESNHCTIAAHSRLSTLIQDGNLEVVMFSSNVSIRTTKLVLKQKTR